MSTMNNAATRTAAQTTTAAAATGPAAAVSSGAGLLAGLHTLAGAVSTFRSLPIGKALTLIKLARRDGPVGSIALFGVGAMVGAGVSLLLTDKSGAEARRDLLDRIKALASGAEPAGDSAEGNGDPIESKAEGFAAKAKDSVLSAEHKLEDAVSEKLGHAKDAIKSTAESAILAAKETTEDVKWVLVSVDPFHHPPVAHAVNGNPTQGKAGPGASPHRTATARHH